MSSAVVWLVAIAFVGCLLWGVVCAARRPVARPLLFVLGSALVLQLGASWVQKWPFGLVRTNLVMVPILYVLAAIGAADLFRRAWRAWSGVRSGDGKAVAGLPLCLAAVLVAFVAGIVVPVTAVANIRGFEERYSQPVFVDRMRDVFRVVRGAVGPDDLVVGVLDEYGWGYYSQFYDDAQLDDAGVARVPADRMLHTNDFASPDIERFVREHPDAPKVVVFNFMGISPELYDQQARWLAASGRCPTRRWDFEQTGIVTEYERTGAPCSEPARQPVKPLQP